MTFEERYGMRREWLLQEVRSRQQEREEARLATLTEIYRQARIAKETAADGIAEPAATEGVDLARCRPNRDEVALETSKAGG
jgi:hypothetical protein